MKFHIGKPCTSVGGIKRQGGINSFTLSGQSFQTEVGRHFFPQRLVNLRNSPAQRDVKSRSLEIFKVEIDKLLKGRCLRAMGICHREGVDTWDRSAMITLKNVADLGEQVTYYCFCFCVFLCTPFPSYPSIYITHPNKCSHIYLDLATSLIVS